MTIRSIGLGSVVGLLLCAATSSAPAAEFVRGDGNDDGTLSVADAHAIMNYLFNGISPPECEDAFDANDDGLMNIADGVYILNRVSRGGPPLPAPYPEAGEDPTEDELDCASAGDGSPIDDPVAAVEILSASSVGGDDASAKIVLGFAHATAIAGFDAHVKFPFALQNSRPLGVQVTGSFQDGFRSVTVSGDSVQASLLFSLVGKHSVPATDTAAALFEIYVCLPEGTAAGSYPLTVDAELVDHQSGRAIRTSGSGDLSVGDDVNAGAECPFPAVDPDPDPDPPSPPPNHVPGGPPIGPENRATSIQFTLADAAAAPGSPVVVPFVVHSNGSINGYAMSADFDEEVLQAVDVTEAWRIPGDYDMSFAKYEWNNDNETEGNAGVDEGFIIAACVFSFTRDVSLPADEDVEVLHFHFDIDEEAIDGPTEIRFMNGGQVSGQPVENIATTQGVAVSPDLHENFVLVDCTLLVQAIVDITTFVRGDSNRDDAVNLADAQWTLNYLFAADGVRPPCFDAADANDDGRLNISDPLFTLVHLFAEDGPAALPAPFPEEGPDPTPDGISCASLSG